MSPLLSVVIPVLNEAQGIRAVLEPLQGLRSAGHEIIVVDGGSTDATCDIARGLSDAVIQAPRGRAAQMNAGVRRARGEMLLFLHADTQLPESAAELILQGMAGDGAPDWGRFDVHISGDSFWFPVIAFMMNWRSRLTGIATGDQAIFVRRSAFKEMGGFPVQPLMEDIEFTARLKRRSRPLCLALRVQTSGRRWQKHGVLRTIVLMWWLRLRYFAGVSADTLAQSYYRGDGK